jgi:hypothetical protein
MTSDALATASAGERTLASWIARVWRAAKRLYLFLLPLRFSFLALIVVAFALIVSAQGYDIIAHLAEDDPTGAERSNDGQRAGYVIGVIFLALQVWYWSRQLLQVKPAEGRPEAREYPWLTAWLPRILGALAFVIAIAALWRVARNYGVPEPVHELRKLAIILGVALIAFIAFCVLRRKQLGYPPHVELTLRERPLAAKVFMGVSGVLALALFLWATFFVQSTVHLGAAAIVLLAFALSVPVGSTLVWLGIRGGVPTLTFLLIWALIVSPLADNHVVRTLPGKPDTRPAIGAAFDRWFERLDRDHPTADGSHPVILVASEGGGIRAAYWTAAVLTSLTDTVPSFAEHTFALSGVSGGALGSTVYDALLVRRGEMQVQVDDDYTPQGREHHSLRFAARQMLSEDALAPTIAAMTQPDLAQRFIPAPVLPDRARALEGAWERAWSETIRRRGGEADYTFGNGFLSMMDGKSDRFPSLFLNGTIVETGQRIIASNLRTNDLAQTVDLFGAVGDDVRVSTAVDNSTRFTYVSPAGTLLRAKSSNGGSPLECPPGARCEHVVDGGYFENSGAATLSDVLSVMARSKYASRIRPHVIFIQFRMGQPTPVESTMYANDVLSPVRALLAVRGAHTNLAATELMDLLGPANYTRFQLVQTKAVFPLGWLLADRTRNLMDKQMGPNSAENGSNVRRIAAVLRQPVGRDLVQELAARGERAPRFQD